MIVAWLGRLLSKVLKKNGSANLTLGLDILLLSPDLFFSCKTTDPFKSSKHRTGFG